MLRRSRCVQIFLQIIKVQQNSIPYLPASFTNSNNLDTVETVRNELDVQNGWEENTQNTHTVVCSRADCISHVIIVVKDSKDFVCYINQECCIQEVVCMCVCVCVFSSHSFWTSSSLDVPAGVTQEEGHTGFFIHLLSAVRALTFLARRIQPFLSLVDREVEFCVLTTLIVLHPLGIFFFFLVFK